MRRDECLSIFAICYNLLSAECFYAARVTAGINNAARIRATVPVFVCADVSFVTWF
jgi:hypothetical protein